MFKKRKTKSPVADSTPTTAIVATNPLSSTPDYHLTMKVVNVEEIPPSPDDVLVCSERPGTFQFAQLMLCGPTNYILIRQRHKSGAIDPDMHMAYSGSVYFRDIPPRTPRDRLPEPTKHGATVHRPGALDHVEKLAAASTAPAAVAPAPAARTKRTRTVKKTTTKTTAPKVPEKRGRSKKNVA